MFLQFLNVLSQLKGTETQVHRVEIVTSPNEILAIEKRKKQMARSGNKRFKLQVTEMDQKVLGICVVSSKLAC